MILYTYLPVNPASNACTALNPKITSLHTMKAIYIKFKSLRYARPPPSAVGAIYKKVQNCVHFLLDLSMLKTIVMYIYRPIYLANFYKL